MIVFDLQLYKTQILKKLFLLSDKKRSGFCTYYNENRNKWNTNFEKYELLHITKVLTFYRITEEFIIMYRNKRVTKQRAKKVEEGDDPTGVL